MPARVASAEETFFCERATIESGIPSAELMRRAGNRAAAVIRSKYQKSAQKGALVFAGPGNNGGDGWVVAESLARAGILTRVIEAGAPKSDEAIAARNSALQASGIRVDTTPGEQLLVIDALLGTGSTGAPRGEIAAAIKSIEDLKSSGATIVALDLPSGVNATTGSHEGAVTAAATISFGMAKRGHLIAREACGEITIVDIGLRAGGAMNALPELIDLEWVQARIPKIPVDAHKGTRKRLAVIGGSSGMAGAAILSGQGALRSGIGLLRIYCAAESLSSIRAAIPAAISRSWPETPEDLSDLTSNVDCVAIGPGLGNNASSRDLVERVMLAWNGPVVLDADALNVFAGDLGSLEKLLGKRDAVLTPHPAEMGRLIGSSTDEVLANRFEIGIGHARSLNAAIVLKGSPTIVFSPTGSRYVVASGTAALATGGSGDVLTGMVATLLAQMESLIERPAHAAAAAAFVHGHAAEKCRYVRGITLDDILQTLPVVWNEQARPLGDGILAELERHT